MNFKSKLAAEKRWFGQTKFMSVLVQASKKPMMMAIIGESTARKKFSDPYFPSTCNIILPSPVSLLRCTWHATCNNNRINVYLFELNCSSYRGYYRCTYLYSQGCQAKKEIQMSNDDPTVFNVRYRGSHTCNPNPLPSPPQPQPATLENQEPRSVQIQQEDNLMNLRRNLKVTIDNLDNSSHGHDKPSPSSYDFASSSGIKVGEIDCGFQQLPMAGNSFVGSLSPCFVSPGTSGSSCFTMSPTTPHVENLVGTQFVPASEVEIMEIPTATSGSNSPVVSVGFPFHATMGFDFNFTFDNNNHGFFD